MRTYDLRIEGVRVPVIACNTVVVGSGAAGYCAALRLHDFGQTDVVLVTEGTRMGTSRNTGSDKQTYYKLSLGGDAPDSPLQMARDLFAGKAVDGDTALVEAALSTRAFLQLCELGVEFPVNRWGEYCGYRTDHDERARATSAGPLTSKRMTECLEAAVGARGISVQDGYQAVAVLQDEGRTCGILALSKRSVRGEDGRLTLFAARNVVYATGGPAGIYGDTVYPMGHTGASGIAFEAGVRGKNLTEWQFGLASVAPRWNVSGTYMQVLPRFLSVDAQGVEREFLLDGYADVGTCLSMVFRKGYEWPFDCRKAEAGSSAIDLLVYREHVLKGRRVYLDFRSNPQGTREIDYTSLQDEAREYLERAGACFGTPIDRLLHMNAPAYDLYLSKGVDLKVDRLEIALCAQHNNGGLDVDAWWQTSLPGFFAVGEVAGTHGVYRPGGSALNAGQVGATRAAQYIAAHGQGPAPQEEVLLAAAGETVAGHIHLCRRLLRTEGNVRKLLAASRARMSAVGGAIREVEGMLAALDESRALLAAFGDEVSAGEPAELAEAYRLRDCLLSQVVYLSAMIAYAEAGGKSRGSALHVRPEGSRTALEGAYAFDLDDGARDALAQVVQMASGTQVDCGWRAVHPIPEEEGAFETVWRRYREDGNVF